MGDAMSRDRRTTGKTVLLGFPDERKKAAPSFLPQPNMHRTGGKTTPDSGKKKRIRFRNKTGYSRNEPIEPSAETVSTSTFGIRQRLLL